MLLNPKQRIGGSKAIGKPEYAYVAKTGKGSGVITRYKEIGIDLLDTSISRPWTPDGEGTLIDLYYAGYNVKAMCRELNRTWPDVGSRLVKLGMEGRIDPEGWPREGELYAGIEWGGG